MLSRRTLLAGALIAATPLAAQAAAGTPAPTAWLDYERRLRARLSDAGGGDFSDPFARDLLAAGNAFRGASRLGLLQWDEALAACARAHAADMVHRAYFAHEAPEGFTHADRVSLLTRDSCGRSAENLAWRDDGRGRTTPAQIEDMWEQSPGHRRNLENPAYTRVGYGVVRRGGAVYAAGVYAEVGVRLSSPLPLRMPAGADLGFVLQGATPRIERLTVTPPRQSPASAAGAGKAPSSPGLWQLRPLRAAGAGRFEVLPGPLFFVA